MEAVSGEERNGPFGFPGQAGGAGVRRRNGDALYMEWGQSEMGGGLQMAASHVEPDRNPRTE